MRTKPPRLAALLIEIVSPRKGRDEIIGDLNERFLGIIRDSGVTTARRWYRSQAVRSTAAFAKHFVWRSKGRRVPRRQKSPGTRRSSGWEFVRSIVADTRIAVRSFRRHPGAIFVAIASLCVGIGTSVTIFSVVDVYMFRSLPFPEADELVHVYTTLPERGWNFNSVSIPVYLDFRDESRTMDIAASYPEDVNLSGGDRPERVGTERVSWNYFEIFQVQPIIGRAFRPEEERDGEHRVAVLSNGLWQRRFGSDPSLVGHTIQLDAEPYTVIGILPPNFRFGLAITDVWTPFGLTGDEARLTNILSPVGRLRPGATVTQAHADISGIADRLAEAYPEVLSGWGGGARDLEDYIVPPESLVGMLILIVAAAFVLLIACTNVANLMLTRASGRAREIAVIGALGASRTRIVRQLLTDSMVVACLGGLLGIPFSWVGTGWFMSLMPAWVPRAEEVGVDGRVLVFAVAATTLTGVLFGIAPALKNSTPNFSQSLKDGARSVAGTQGGGLRKALVVSQVTLALTLLVGSALLVRGYFSLQARETGWNDESVLTFRVSLPQSEYEDGESVRSFYRSLIPKLNALPGVESSGAISILPLQSNSNTFYDVPGQEAPTPQQRPLAEFRYVSPSYFPTMQIAFVAGRNFGDLDRPDTRPVVVVNEMLAELQWPGDDPVGKQVDFWGQTREIVGVIENTMTLHDRTRPMIFLSAEQSPRNSMSLAVRTNGEPTALVESVRDEVAALDANLPLHRVMSMEDVVKEGRLMDTLMAKLMAAIAVVALLLSVSGVYGVISYAVAHRTQEMGIRMALGARGANVLGLVLRQGVLLTGIGIAIGIVTASLTARGMSLWLFGVSPFDAVSFSASILILLVASVAASYFPARRVARLDPLKVLRYE